MVLFAIPFTCSLAVRLSLAQRAVPHTVRWMRRFEHRLDDGADYDLLNPKRRVPALLLPDGELLTEIVSILMFLESGVPRAEPERRRLHEQLCYLSTELHRPILAALFDPQSPPATVDDVLNRQLPPVLAHLDGLLSQAPTLLGGEAPSAADLYLLWGLALLRFRGVDAARSPALDAYFRRISTLDWVAPLLADERNELNQRA